MPNPLRIELPLVVSGRGELSLVRAVGFDEFSFAAKSPSIAAATIVKRIQKACREFNGSELVDRILVGSPVVDTLSVTIAPESRDQTWREPVTLPLTRIVWRSSDSILVTHVPALDLTVVAGPTTDLDRLLDEQIRSAIRRSNRWSLGQLAMLTRCSAWTLHQQLVDVELPTPLEYDRLNTNETKDTTPTLRQVATRHGAKHVSPAFHRDGEVERLARLLSADTPQSVLLVGPSGVGKTAIVHQWFRSRSVDDMRPIWATDGSRLISGQSGFGMWQQQVIAMVADAKKTNAIVHLGNLAELCESGKNGPSGGCGSLLAPRIADGDFCAIAECTPEQYTRTSRTEPRLIAAMTVLRIDEPTADQTASILLDSAAAYRPTNVTAKRKKTSRRKLRQQQKSGTSKRNHSPTIDADALVTLDRLHRRFQTDAASPGRPLAFFRSVIGQLAPDQTLDKATVIEAFGRQTGLPLFLIDDSVRPDLDEIERRLKSQVIGQDAVIDAVIDTVATVAADLARGDRPLASLLLIGPTGVGKTETAKALAKLIYSDQSRLVRIDMSELSTPMAVGRLIGDGVHPEGLLTAAVRAQPFSLVLLDEFEKAHASVFDLLLQVLGEGRLTDGRGRVADFRNTIVIMTSNLGVESFRQQAFGLAETQAADRYRNHFERQVRDFLRPELFNRIDQLLCYQPLGENELRKIAELRIDELKRRDGWKAMTSGVGDDIAIDPSAIDSLVAGGFEPQYGARPLTRAIERALVVPIARERCHRGRQTQIRFDVATDDAGKLVVAAQAIQRDDQRDCASVMETIQTRTQLRRRGQRLLTIEPIRQLRTEVTRIDRGLQSTKKDTRRGSPAERQKAERMWAETWRIRAAIGKPLHDAKRMVKDMERSESQLLDRYYRHHTIDIDAEKETSLRLKERLFELLFALSARDHNNRSRVTLSILGPTPTHLTPLIHAYQTLAATQNWSLETYAILPRDRITGGDRIVDCPGWSESAAFRVEVVRDSAVEGVSQKAGSRPEPPLAAYRRMDEQTINDFPNGTLGLLLTFYGENAALMLHGEGGIHAFGSNRSPNKAAAESESQFLIESVSDTSLNYRAPAWLPTRDFRYEANPKRVYRIDDRMVTDFSDGGMQSIKMDRDGMWLKSLVQSESERRIWAMLDDG